jgi:hypothetical protein
LTTQQYFSRFKNTSIWAKENPMLAIALFIGPFLCLVGLVSFAFGFIRTWSEYGTLLQSTGWIIGPIGAAVALHYSGQRTAQMIKQVDTQMASNAQKLFMDALGFIHSEKHHEQMAAITSMRSRVFALEDTFYEATCMALEDFIKNPSPRPIYQRKEQKTEPKTLYIDDSGVQEPLRIAVVQEAFRTLLFLRDERRKAGLGGSDKHICFIKLNIVGMTLEDDGEMHKFKFTDCNLSGASINNKQMRHVTFQGCSLDKRNFKGSKLIDCVFTGKKPNFELSKDQIGENVYWFGQILPPTT